MTDYNLFIEIVFFLVGFCTVMFKDIFPFNIIWRYFSLFLVIFFGTLFFNNIKDKFKNFLK